MLTYDFSGKWTQTPDCGFAVVETFAFTDASGTALDFASDPFSTYIRRSADYASPESGHGKIYASTLLTAAVATYNLKATLTFTVALNSGTTLFTETDYAFTI